MSYYYNYYAGYIKDGKVCPLGPFNCLGKIKPLLSRSKSFASNLHEYFNIVKEDEISDELRKVFEYEDYNGNKRVKVKVASLKDLPSGDFIKKGYYLISDVQDYEKENTEGGEYFFDGFYNVISPNVYLAKLENELKFGKNQPVKDAEGYECTEHNASDYMFYAIPDYGSMEFETFILGFGLSNLETYSLGDVEYVILEDEG